MGLTLEVDEVHIKDVPGLRIRTRADVVPDEQEADLICRKIQAKKRLFRC